MSDVSAAVSRTDPPPNAGSRSQAPRTAGSGRRRTLGVALLVVVLAAGVAWQWRQTQHAREVALAAYRLTELAHSELAAERERTAAPPADDQQARAELRLMSYFRAVNLAHQAALAGQPVQAEALLSACPEGLRHWEWHYVHRLIHTEAHALTGHQNLIKGLAVSPDGQFAATTTAVGEVRVWRLDDGQCVRAFAPRTNEDKPRGLAFFADSKVHFSADSGTLWEVFGTRLHGWNLTTGRPLELPPALTPGVSERRLSPDARWLVDVIHRTSWKMRSTPNGEQFVADHEATATIRETATGKVLYSFSDPVPRLSYLAPTFSPDGSLLVARLGETLQVHNTAPWSRRHVLTLPPGQPPFLDGLALSRDNRWLAWAGERTLQLWDLSTGKAVRAPISLPSPLGRVAFSQDGKAVVTAAGAQLLVWEVSTGNLLHTLQGNGLLELMRVSPQGDRLAARDGATIRVWDTTNWREVEHLIGSASPVEAFAFSPDGSKLVAHSGLIVRVWDAATPRRIVTPERFPARTAQLSFSADGRWLTAACRSDEIPPPVWETQKWKLHAPFYDRVKDRHKQPTLTAFAPQGGALYLDKQQKLHGMRLDTDELFEPAIPALPTGVPQPYGQAILSPNLRLLAADDDQSGVSVWEQSESIAEPGWKVKFRPLQAGERTPFHFGGPSGMWLAVASASGTVYVWDAATGRERSTWQTHIGTVTHVTLSPDGKRLAAGNTRTLKLYDVATGAEALSLSVPGQSIQAATFSPDGRQLYAQVESDTAAPALVMWDSTPRLRR